MQNSRKMYHIRVKMIMLLAIAIARPHNCLNDPKEQNPDSNDISKPAIQCLQQRNDFLTSLGKVDEGAEFGFLLMEADKLFKKCQKKTEFKNLEVSILDFIINPKSLIEGEIPSVQAEINNIHTELKKKYQELKNKFSDVKFSEEILDNINSLNEQCQDFVKEYKGLVPFYVLALQKISVKSIKIKLMLSNSNDKNAVICTELKNVFEHMLEGKTKEALRVVHENEKLKKPIKDDILHGLNNAVQQRRAAVEPENDDEDE